MENKVYIIIVNYINYEDTIACLESVLKSAYTNFQIILIDNSPDDLPINNLVAWLTGGWQKKIDTPHETRVYPLVNKPIPYFFAKNEAQLSFEPKIDDDKIILVKTINQGFAAANNVALRYILKHSDNPSFVWLLNNDTVIEKITLSNLVRFYQDSKNDKVILGAKLRHFHKPDVIQAIAGKYNNWLGKHSHIGSNEADAGQYDNYKTGKKNYVIGASIFFQKIFLEAAGLMCEDYFLYFEELDWMQVGFKNGFSMAVATDAIVYHKEGSSIIENKNNKKDTSTAEYYSIASRVKFIKKWYPYALVTVMPGVIYALVKRVLQGKFTLVKKATIAIFIILTGGNAPVFKNDKNSTHII